MMRSASGLLAGLRITFAELGEFDRTELRIGQDLALGTSRRRGISIFLRLLQLARAWAVHRENRAF